MEQSIAWRGKALVLAMAFAFPALTASAEPGSSAWSQTEQTSLRLITASQALGAEGFVRVGLHVQLRDGWKIYWRSPGDAGFGPRIDWSGSTNLEETRLLWPAPRRFSVLGLETLGYQDEVVLPIEATPRDRDQTLSLRAKVDYLTCDDICIPYTARLALDIPPGDATPTELTHLIDRFVARVPGDGARHGLAIERLETPEFEEGAPLTLVASARQPFESPDLFLEGPVELVFAKPELRFDDGHRRLSAEIPVEGAQFVEGGLVGTELTVTLVDGLRSAELKLAVEPAGETTVGEVGSFFSLAWVLALALAGGLILNLMPCVLPVLSIKLLGVIGHGGGERRPVRLGFLASAAGILVSFWVLAAGLSGLKAAGQIVGWGIQFQQPWFLVAMALIVTLFAANLWGFFEIGLPRAITETGHLAGDTRGLGGHFMTGAFATLLATPCSAPFLGTAVGFALSRGTGEILLVFTALGLGLALPYLAVAAMPGLATRLPRPGRWMVILRRVLGFALAGTAIWLVTVLAAVITPGGAAAIGFLMLAIVGFLAAGRRFGSLFGKATMGAVGVLAALAFIIPATVDRAPSRTSPADSTDGEFWVPFDDAAIANHVAQGRVVFVDVTADWCVTCQVNKRLVLYQSPIADRLRDAEVVAMQADWTRPDAAISRYLARFGRYGIPFNAVYGPGAPDGVVLPELLTDSAVGDALDRAAARTTSMR